RSPRRVVRESVRRQRQAEQCELELWQYEPERWARESGRRSDAERQRGLEGRFEVERGEVERRFKAQRRELERPIKSERQKYLAQIDEAGGAPFVRLPRWVIHQWGTLSAQAERRELEQQFEARRRELERQFEAARQPPARKTEDYDWEEIERRHQAISDGYDEYGYERWARIRKQKPAGPPPNPPPPQSSSDGCHFITSNS